MAINARKIKHTGGSKFPRPPALDVGTYPARVVQILDLGLQKQRPYKGEEKDPAHELYVTYEMLDEFMLDEEGNELTDKPRWLSEKFPLHSLEADLAKSTKRYYALDPEEEFKGDWLMLAAAPCMITLSQNPSKKDPEVVYNNISAVSGMRAKDVANSADLVNEAKVFDMDEPDMKTFLSLPKWLQDVMKENLDFGGSMLEKAIESYGDGSSGDEDKPSGSGSSDKGKEDSNSEDW